MILDWKCGNCFKRFLKPNYRYLFHAKIKDHTNELWVKVFDEIGEIILGI